MMRGKRDANQTPLVAAAELMGASFLDLSQIRIEGAPDGLLGVAGIDQLVEFKNPERRERDPRSEGQKRFHRNWRGRRVVVVENIDDLITLLKAMRREGFYLQRINWKE